MTLCGASLCMCNDDSGASACVCVRVRQYVSAYLCMRLCDDDNNDVLECAFECSFKRE